MDNSLLARLQEWRKISRSTTREGNQIKNQDRAESLDLYNLFESLVKNEQGLHRNYSEIARSAVAQFFPDKQDQAQKVVQEFLGQLARLDYRGLVYENIQQDLQKVAERYGPSVKKIYLWSEGDTEHTGWQVFKILRSGLKKVLKAIEKKTHLEFSWAVSPDKITNIQSALFADSSALALGPKKIVMIDDRIQNYKNLKQCLEDRVEIFFIWAAYSRKGLKMQKEHPAKYESNLTNYHGVKSFGEIADRFEEFAPYFKDAEVLLDFDGVLMDNQKTSEAVSRALWQALVKGLNLSLEEQSQLLAKLQNQDN